MASIIERLTEGVVNRDMRAEGHALLSKWERTGLLEGLTSDRKKQSMARLLENQAKELLRESSSMSAGDVEGFAAVAFPIVRRVFAGLIANDLVSVQPMSLPSGLIFFLDFVFSPNLGSSGTLNSRFGNIADKSIYGTDQVGSQITGGVDLLGTLKGDLGGPRTVGARGYAYASPSGSTAVTSSAVQLSVFSLTGSTVAQRKSIQFDPDLLALSSSATARWIVRVDVAQSTLDSDLDYNNLGAVSSSVQDLGTMTGLSFTNANTEQLRRLTQVTGANGNVQQYWISSLDSIAAAIPAGWVHMTSSFPVKDAWVAGTGLGSVAGTAEWGLEGSELIPEIDIKVDSVAVTAQTKKLKTSTHTITWMQRWNLLQSSPSKSLLRLTVRFLLTLLTVQPLQPTTGHVLQECS